MSLARITEAIRIMEQADAGFSAEDREFVAQYAFHANDEKTVAKLIEELQEADADRGAVRTRYMQRVKSVPQWAEHIERLLSALELYRQQEKRAVRRIADFLMAHGIAIPEAAIKDADVEAIKSMVADAVPQMPGQKMEEQERAALL
jgi:hypothetical protein